MSTSSQGTQQSVSIPWWLKLLAVISTASLLAIIFYLDSSLMPRSWRNGVVLVFVVSLVGVQLTVGTILTARILTRGSKLLGISPPHHE